MTFYDSFHLFFRKVRQCQMTIGNTKSYRTDVFITVKHAVDFQRPRENGRPNKQNKIILF